MIVAFIYLILGFALLLIGADWLVKGAASLAKRFNVPQIVIGLTIVAFGTSAPELLVNIFSSIKGASDIAFGNVIGSNNFNALIILGVSTLIYPLHFNKNSVTKEIPFILFISVFLFFLVNDRIFSTKAPDVLSRGDGIILLLIFALFIAYTFYLSKKSPVSPQEIKEYKILASIGFVLLGLGGLIWGGKIVVTQAISIAQKFGISEKIIALTIVAAGTSLPELATSAVAAFKKHSDIAVGNILGSNIFNLLLILGVSSTIRPAVYRTAFNKDFMLMTLGTVLIFVFLFTSRKNKLDRWEGGVLLLLYVAYAVFLLK
ncbi:MAG: calcium/sodium antiporter [Candidatus Cloacimonetes bacterium]|nr:calcium/sodium antiporter [Candidatus Cloacimonadota bacterium]